MMRQIKQHTAANVMIFMTSSTDHFSGKTGLTLTINASKDGAAFSSIAPTVNERGNGWYGVSFATAHLDTLGELALHVTATGADAGDFKLLVVEANTGELTPTERTATANEIESQIINDADSEKVLEAIVNKINAMTDLDALTLAAIASAIRSELTLELARLDTEVSSRLAADDYLPSGGSTVQVLPLITTVQTQPVRAASLVAYRDAAITHRVAVFDAAGEPIDLSGKSLQFVVEALDGNEIGHIETLTVDGPDSNQVVIDAPAAFHSIPGLDRYAVRDLDDGARVWLHGDYIIEPAAGPHV
jgi:hypothetical protein